MRCNLCGTPKHAAARTSAPGLFAAIRAGGSTADRDRHSTVYCILLHIYIDLVRPLHTASVRTAGGQTWVMGLAGQRRYVAQEGIQERRRVPILEEDGKGCASCSGWPLLASAGLSTKHPNRP